MSISWILQTFLLEMGVGMVMAIAVLPTTLIDTYFFKSIGFWSFLFTASGLIVGHYSTIHLPEIFGGVSAGSSYLPNILFGIFSVISLVLWLSIKILDGAPKQGFLWIHGLVGLTAVSLHSLQYRPAIEPLWTQSVLVPLHFLSTSVLLGSFLAGMIFGHWYLINTEMPKRLLVRMAWVMIVAMVFRLVAVGMTLGLFEFIIRPDVPFLQTLTALDGHGIFFWQRTLVGLLVPSVVVFMIWSTARIGSNQSATGIMYVAVAFVFIGELVARYLFILSAIPL